MIPRDNDRAGSPRFPHPELMNFDNLISRPAAQRGDGISIRIDQNGLQTRIKIVFAIEQQDAGIGGDGDSYLVGHFQTAAPFKILLGDEDLDMTPQRPLLLRREACIVRNIPLQNG